MKQTIQTLEDMTRAYILEDRGLGENIFALVEILM